MPSGIDLLEQAEKDLSFTEGMKRDEWEHRKRVSGIIVGAFRTINVIILIMVSLMFLIESVLVYNLPSPYVRVVDSKTIMALIGATTVQFGAIALGVSNWLFPRKRS